MTTHGEPCRCCAAGAATGRPRVCPECGHRFAGNGWDGIDAHWRSKHEARTGVRYEEFWASLCREHRDAK